MPKEKRMTAFETYFAEVNAIVSLLEQIADKRAKCRKYAHENVPDDDFDEMLDSLLGENERKPLERASKIRETKKAIDALRAKIAERIATIATFDKYEFNLERFIATQELDERERYILYILIAYALYGDALSNVSMRKILELISVDGEIYLTNYHYLTANAKLVTLGVIALSREMFAGDSGSDLVYTNVGLASSKLLFAFLEQAPWRYLQKQFEKPVYVQFDAVASSGFDSIIETITPKEIVKELDKYVIGQARAKRVLAVQAYLHYIRVKHSDFVPYRSNIMMVGPTGVGKTYLAKKLADILGLPFVRADVTTLTETGYVGDDVEIVLYDLFRKANNDIALAEKGVIFFDEVDKIAKADAHQSTTGNPSDKAVQEALLSMLNGEEVRVPESGDRRMMHGSEGIVINTKNILFIFGGAFVGLEDTISERLRGDQTFGFNTPLVDGKRDREKLLNKLDVKDLEKYGMIPEFLGRIPITVVLNKLSLSEMEVILTKSADSPLIKYFEFFKMLGKRLIVSNEAAKAIVERAAEIDMGARSLKHIVENVMVDILYHYDAIKGTTLKVTKKLVLDSFERAEENDVSLDLNASNIDTANKNDDILA